ncbi:MAG: hypothetical protein NTW76_09920 [Corynebacteriales bacterium]|nr:hypothetical protein [Mycobacteriales bacterium]
MAVRLIDQGLWSISVFALNITAGLLLDTDLFAGLAVGSAIGFIGVAAARAWGTIAPVVVGAREGIAPEQAIHRGSSWTGALLVAALCAGATLAWLSFRVSAWNALIIAGVAALIVLSDFPRQILVIESRYRLALSTSVCYLVLSIASCLVVVAADEPELLIPLWAVSCLLTMVIGSVLSRDPLAVGRRPVAIAYAWRLTAEAFYIGVGGQISIILLYFVSDNEATSGIRFANTLVFGPCFVLIQGLQPLVMKQIARIFDSGSAPVVRVGIRWCGLVAAIMLVVGSLAALILATGLSESRLALALPFLLPIGFGILTAQIFDAALLIVRFYSSPTLVHRFRLVSVVADVGAQIVGVTLDGARGLLIAVVAAGAVRLVASGLLVSGRAVRDGVPRAEPAGSSAGSEAL